MAFWNSSTPSVANTILSAQVDVICSMLDQMYVDCPRIEPSLQLPHGVNLHAIVRYFLELTYTANLRHSPLPRQETLHVGFDPHWRRCRLTCSADSKVLPRARRNITRPAGDLAFPPRLIEVNTYEGNDAKSFTMLFAALLWLDLIHVVLAGLQKASETARLGHPTESTILASWYCLWIRFV